jgi:hypothetical protein
MAIKDQTKDMMIKDQRHDDQRSERRWPKIRDMIIKDKKHDDQRSEK